MNSMERLRVSWGEKGQSTLEYALVFSAFLAIILALWALFEFSSGEKLGEFIELSTSHVIGGGKLHGVKDILLF